MSGAGRASDQQAVTGLEQRDVHTSRRMKSPVGLSCMFEVGSPEGLKRQRVPIRGGSRLEGGPSSETRKKQFFNVSLEDPPPKEPLDGGKIPAFASFA